MRLPRARSLCFGLLGLLFLLPTAAPSAVATVLLDEPFSYPDGDLAGTGGWTAFGPAVGIKPLQIFAGQLRELSSPGDGEDCWRPLNTPQPPNAVTFFSFKLRVPSTGPNGGPADVGQPYNVMVTLRDAAGGTNRCLVGVGDSDGIVISPPFEGDYTIQLSGSGGFSLIPDPNSNYKRLYFDVEYTVVARYDAATGECELWVDPLIAGDAYYLLWDGAWGGAETPVNAVAVYQRNAGSSNSYQFIDDLLVGTSLTDVYTLPMLPPAADAFVTSQLGPPPGTGTTVNFASAPIPADFFGPGSDPFDGIISFSGDPIEPGVLGETDVRILRSADPFEPAEPPSPHPVQIDIEIVELSLQSVEPIVVTSGTSSTSWDVHLGLAGPQPTGHMFVTKTGANGGVFDMSVPVLPVYTFTNTSNPGDVRVLPAADPIRMEYLAVPWVHVVDPSLNVYVPPGATFVPGVEEIPPGVSTSQRPVSVMAQQIATVTGHSIPAPGVPEMEHTLGAPLAPIPPQADLAVEKTVDLPAPHEGETITYTVVLTNNGPSEATGVVVTDLLPAGVTFVSSTPSIGTYDDGSGQWTVGSLAVGSATLLIAATVDLGNVGATISNTASVTAVDQTDIVLGNESASADVTVAAGVGVDAALPAAVALEAGRPNPFRTTTTLRFGIPAATDVRLSIYDVSGALVRTLIERSLPPGWYAPEWDGRNAAGRRVAPGLYYVRLDAGSVSVRSRVVRMN